MYINLKILGKILPMFSDSIWLRCGLLLSVFLCITCFPLKSDRTKSATFTADHVTYNEKEGQTIFTGQVEMDQGTTHLTGDQVVIQSDSQGHIIKITAQGTLAHYTELPDHQDKIIDAFGETIEYYPIKAMAVLINQAELKQGKNSFKAPKIIYDIEKQIILSTPTQQEVQSVIVIQPQDLPGKRQSR